MISRFAAIALPVLSFSAVSALAADKDPIRVALYDDEGAAGKGVPRTTEIVGKAEGMKLTTVTAEDIRAGKLKDYDVVMFTGGSGSKQGNSLQPEGVKNVVEFVEKGGGYVGICGGAFLACNGFSWSTNLINAKVISPKWRRGKGMMEVELTEEGKKIFPGVKNKFECLYHNGPVVKVAKEDQSPLVPLAYFRTEVAENETPAGIMVDTPAIAAGVFGKGTVITISPHPEQTPGLEPIIVDAVKHVAPKAEKAK